MIKNNNSIKKITYLLLLSLLPLILFGLYKNGIKLYIKNYVNIIGMLKPFFFALSGLLIGILVNIIYERIIKKNKSDLIEIIFSSFHPIYGLLIACISSINTNIFLFISVVFFILFISKFIKYNKVNYVALTSLIIFFIMNIFNKFSFLNAYESSNKFNLDAIDFMFGNGSGGIFTTNIILLIISFIVLYNIKVYKKNIPIFATISFTILTVIYCFMTNNVGNITNMLFSNGILFSFIFVATDPISSSYTKKGIIIYGIFVGCLTFILHLFQPALSSLGAILIASIFNNLFDLKFE